MPPLPRQGTIPLQFHYLESLSLAQGFSLTRAAQASLLQNLLLQVPGPPSYASSMLRNVYPPDCPVLSQSGTRSSPGQENQHGQGAQSAVTPPPPAPQPSSTASKTPLSKRRFLPLCKQLPPSIFPCLPLSKQHLTIDLLAVEAISC